MRGRFFKGAGLIAAIVIAVLVLAVVVRFFGRHDIAVLAPKGTISHQERNLIFLALALCAIVVIPVFTLAIMIAVRYREGNKKKVRYTPDWDGDRRYEITWWAVPLAIITILAFVTWFSSYSLDPFRVLASTKKPLNIQVISLNWKWLFIYPEQDIATVNYVRLPLDTPVNFQITSDSVMNSFWVPNLAGQIYAMPGMSTQLHVMGGEAGNYPGSSANISGRGFAGMRFDAAVTSPASFASWVRSVRTSTNKLNMAEYQKLAKPSENSPVTYYASAQSGLFQWVVDKYMVPASQLALPGSGSSMPAMQMGGM